MTFSSWRDLPPGLPMHHHCLATVEQHHDPKHWPDASQLRPHFVGWTPGAVVDWIRQTIKQHLPDATDEHRPWVEDALEPQPLPDGVPDLYPPKWKRITGTLQMGRWMIQTHQLGIGRKLVIQVIGYADAGSPRNVNGIDYEVCQQHRRRSDEPYQGLTEWQTAHAAKYGSLYAAYQP